MCESQGTYIQERRGDMETSSYDKVTSSVTTTVPGMVEGQLGKTGQVTSPL